MGESKYLGNLVFSPLYLKATISTMGPGQFNMKLNVVLSPNLPLPMSLADSGKAVMLTLFWTASLRKQSHHLKWSSREEPPKRHCYLHKYVFAMLYCELLNCPYPCITRAFNSVVDH